jgi:hypothetical protein
LAIPKIEELHLPVRGHQDVRGLEVAMDDEVRVGEPNGVAYLAKEPKPLAHRQDPGITMGRDW